MAAVAGMAGILERTTPTRWRRHQCLRQQRQRQRRWQRRCRRRQQRRWRPRQRHPWRLAPKTPGRTETASETAPPCVVSISPLVFLKCSIHHPTPPTPTVAIRTPPPRLWRDGPVRLGGGTAWQRGKTSKDGQSAACGGDGGDGRGCRGSRGGGGTRRQAARPRGKARSTLTHHPSPIWRGSTPYWGIGCQTRKYVGRYSRGPPTCSLFRLCIIALWRDAAGQGHNTSERAGPAAPSYGALSVIEVCSMQRNRGRRAAPDAAATGPPEPMPLAFCTVRAVATPRCGSDLVITFSIALDANIVE